MANATCSIDGCDRTGKMRRGWCSLHYGRWKRHGNPEHHPPSVEERFWAKVNKTDTCWLWTASLDTRGYGQFGIRHGKLVRAHRYAYESLAGPHDAGLELDHLCRVRRCVNPDHLEPVTHRTNVLRGVAPVAKRARQTHCRRGHPLTGSNLYIKPNGTRQCRRCHADRERQRYRESRSR